MARTVAAWVGFWTLFGLIDWAADKRERSLCTAVRWTFRSNTRPGRAALAATFWTGAVVLWRHLDKHTT